MKFLNTIIFLTTILSILSCEEEINWQVAELPEMIVVEGSFTNEFKIHRITLSKSATYFSNQPTPKISDAMVTITDGTNTFPLEENPAGSGVYKTIDSVAGEQGKTYTLDINLNDPINNATHYYASGEMVKGIDIDSTIALIYENPMYISGGELDSLMIVMIIVGQEPSGIKNYYQMDLYRNGILLNDTIDKVNIMDDTEGLEGQYINAFFFFNEYSLNDTVGFEIQSVSKAYFEFVNGIQNLANQSFDPFNMSGPPANSTGNIEGAEAIGFFKVACVSRGSALAQYYQESE